MPPSTSQKRKERAETPAVPEVSAIDLASATFAPAPANLIATDSLKVEKGIIETGAAMRANAAKLLEGVKIEAGVREQLISNMQGERPDWHDQLLLEICNTLLADSVPLFSDPERGGLKTPPIRDRAAYIGCAHFCDILIKADAALAEEVFLFSRQKKIDPALVVPRLEHFMLEHANSTLYPLGVLLNADAEEENSLGASYLLRGMLKPYLQMAQAIPEERSFFGFLSKSPRSPTALGDLVISKHIAKFLENFLEAAYKKPPKERAPRDRITDAESWADQKLQTIFSTLKNETDVLNTIEPYIDSKKALSVYDLALIAKRLPRGINWGRFNDYQTLGDLSKSQQPHSKFEPADLRILYKAIEKTTKPDGNELCGEVGMEIRKAIESSYAIAKDAENSDGFKNAIQYMFSNALGKIFGELLAK